MAFDETIQHGTTSKIIEVMLRDSSTGQGKTALAHGDVTASYIREGSTRTAITLASGTAGDSYSSGKWCEVDATNTPGVYQLHIPNAALASGVNAATLFLKASGVIDSRIRIGLIAVDVRDANDLGLTNLDTTVSSRNATTPLDAAGIRSAVGLASANLDTQISTIDGNVDSILVDTGTTLDGKIDTLTTNLATVDGIVDAILVDTDELQTNQGNWLTATGFSTHNAADVWSVATRVLTAGTNLSFATQAQVASEISDALTVDTLIDGKTIQQALQYVGAMLAGKASGAGTGTEVFVGLDGSTTRVTVTVDASGNRSGLTYNG